MGVHQHLAPRLLNLARQGAGRRLAVRDVFAQPLVPQDELAGSLRPCRPRCANQYRRAADGGDAIDLIVDERMRCRVSLGIVPRLPQRRRANTGRCGSLAGSAGRCAAHPTDSAAEEIKKDRRVTRGISTPNCAFFRRPPKNADSLYNNNQFLVKPAARRRRTAPQGIKWCPCRDAGRRDRSAGRPGTAEDCATARAAARRGRGAGTGRGGRRQPSRRHAASKAAIRRRPGPRISRAWRSRRNRGDGTERVRLGGRRRRSLPCCRAAAMPITPLRRRRCACRCPTD